MSIPLSESSQKNMKIYGTMNNTYEDFPIGTHVKIICLSQDHHFFYGETGKVIKNGGRYLSIKVEYDEPRHYSNGVVETNFNFNPTDLCIYNEASKEISSEQIRLKKLGKEEGALEEENKRRSERFNMMDL